MKANKNTSIICASLAIILSILTVILNTPYNNILENIFTGFIVSSVVALIGYLNEKSKTLHYISYNLRSLYINLLTIKSIAGKIVPEVATKNNLTKLDYDLIDSLSSLNIELIKKMELERFDAFYTNSKLSNIINELIDLKRDLYNLNNLSSQLHRYTIDYTKNEIEFEQLRLQGLKIPVENLNKQSEYKNLINIKTAKLQEYEAGLALRLDKLGIKLDKYNSSKFNWNKFKAESNYC